MGEPELSGYEEIEVTEVTDVVFRPTKKLLGLRKKLRCSTLQYYIRDFIIKTIDADFKEPVLQRGS